MWWKCWRTNENIVLDWKCFCYGSGPCEVFQEIRTWASMRGQRDREEDEISETPECPSARRPLLASHDTRDSPLQRPCSKVKCKTWQELLKKLLALACMWPGVSSCLFGKKRIYIPHTVIVRVKRISTWEGFRTMPADSRYLIHCTLKYIGIHMYIYFNNSYEYWVESYSMAHRI